MYRFLAQITNCPADEPGCSAQTNLPEVVADSDAIQTGLQFVFGIIAVAAVIYIVVGALKLIISQGDPQAISKARRTILYAIVGLVVSLSAEVIVTFVLTKA